MEPASVTLPNVPEVALTVTGVFGAMPVARSAGKTSRTVDGVAGAGAEAPEPRSEPLVDEPPGAAADGAPWQALSTTLIATSTAARALPAWYPADRAFTFYRSQVTAAGRYSPDLR